MEITQDLHLKKIAFEESLAEVIQKMGKKNALRDACEYALLSGGKRIRPLIVLLVGEVLEKGYDVMPSALAVEFFHTASLIADDLPCMDNESERRSKPCLHKVYEESVAILSSYSLISLGYEYIHHNIEILKGVSCPHPDYIGVLALEVVAKASGIHGATTGQFLDLFPTDSSLDTIYEIIDKKTIALFEIAFVLGWLFGGGDKAFLPVVKKLAYHLGMAFQIGDDLEDVMQDQKGSVNIATLLGMDQAIVRYQEEIDLFRSQLKELGLSDSKLGSFIDFIEAYQLKRARL